MGQIDVRDAEGDIIPVELPLAPGRKAAADSRPVVLSTEDSVMLAAAAAALGAPNGAAIKTDDDGTIQRYLRGIVSFFANALGAGTAAASHRVTLASNDPAVTTLASILTTLQAQRSESLWTDDTEAYFVRIDNGGTISWTDVSGSSSSAPGTGARPVAGENAVIDKSSYQAIAAATGYSIGDLIDHVVIANPSSGTVIGSFWLNTTTGLKLASGPSSANITPVDLTAAILGAKTDAASVLTDSTSTSAMSVWKQISKSVQLMVFGAGTAAAAQRTTLASDDPAVAALGATTGAAVTTDANGTIQQYLRGLIKLIAAGTTLLGKVSIDQTTPGTTNLVAAVGLRNIVVKGSINNGQTSYTGSTTVPPNIGGLITVATGLPAGTIINAGTLRIKASAADWPTASNITASYFDANPAATTITDNSSTAVPAADIGKAITNAGSVSLNTNYNFQWFNLAVPRLAVDGSGNFYFAVFAIGNQTLAGTNKISYEFDTSY